MQEPGIERTGWPGGPYGIGQMPWRAPAVARLGPRIGAWLLDGVLLVAASGLVVAIAGAVGAWSFNPQFLSDITADPNTYPAVPAIDISRTGIAVTTVGIGVATVLYAAVCWTMFGAMPGQRILGIRVLELRSSRKLPPHKALLRSIITYGAVAAVVTPVVLLTFEMFATTPYDSLMSHSAQYSLPPDSPLNPWLDALSTVTVLGAAWIGALLLSTASGRLRRGLHDVASGSVVVDVSVSAAAAAAARQWMPYGAAPGWTPPGYFIPPPMPGTQGGPPTPPPWPPPSPSAPGIAGQPDPHAWRAPEDQPGQHGQAAPDRPAWLLEERGKPAGEGKEAVAASIERRAAAYLIDSAVLIVPYMVMLAAVNPDPNVTQERARILVGLAAGALQMIYFVGGWILMKGTFGQKILGISVVDESTANRLPLMDAFIRWAVLQGPFALSTIVPAVLEPFVYFAAGGWAIFLYSSTRNDAGRQGLHDHFLHSRVVRD